MTRVSTAVLLILVLVTACSAQTQNGSQENPANAPTQGESSSKPNPDASPAAPRTPPPDLSEKARKPTGVKGVIDRVAPHCVYVIYSTCWELRSNRRPDVETPNDEYVKNLEVGDYYFKRENFRAAGSRYRDALAQKPNDPEATYRFAKSLEKLNDIEHARIAYQAYLMVAPDGPHAAQARNALERLPAH